MTPLLLAFLLMQTAPAAAPLTSPTPTAAPPIPAPAAEPEPSAEDTYQGLQQVYATTCGQTGILYHAYDEICESLRKQIRTYRDKLDRDHARPSPNPPKR